MKKFFTVLSLTAMLVSTAQESTLLRINYKKGDKYEMKMEMTQDMSSAGMIMDMRMEMDIDVINAEDTVYNTKTSFKRIVMNMEQKGMKMAYDSNKSENELDDFGKRLKTQFDPLLSAAIMTKLNSLGKVLEITFEPNSPALQQYADQSSGVVYPEKALKVGDTWTVTQDKNGIKLDFIYTVKSLEKEKVLLDISGSISSGAEGKITGNMTIDKKSGVPLLSLIDMDMTVMGQTIKSKVKSTMSRVE